MVMTSYDFKLQEMLVLAGDASAIRTTEDLKSISRGSITNGKWNILLFCSIFGTEIYKNVSDCLDILSIFSK